MITRGCTDLLPGSVIGSRGRSFHSSRLPVAATSTAHIRALHHAHAGYGRLGERGIRDPPPARAGAAYPARHRPIPARGDERRCLLRLEIIQPSSRPRAGGIRPPWNTMQAAHAPARVRDRQALRRIRVIRRRRRQARLRRQVPPAGPHPRLRLRRLPIPRQRRRRRRTRVPRSRGRIRRHRRHPRGRYRRRHHPRALQRRTRAQRSPPRTSRATHRGSNRHRRISGVRRCRPLRRRRSRRRRA